MKGFAAGLFKGIKQTTDKVIDMNMKDLSSAKQYMRTRRDQEDKRVRDEEDRYAETIKDLSAFVDRDALPEGATAEDVAGAYFDSALGGSVRQAEAAIVELTKARNSLGAESAKLIMTNAGQLGLTARDIAKKYVKPMDLEYVKGSEQFGISLPFMDKFNIRERAVKAVGLPQQEQMEKLNLGTAGTKGKFVTQEEYKLTKQLTETKIKQAQADYKKTLSEADLKDAMSFNEYKGQITTNVQDVLRPYDIPVDADGNFSLKTAKQQVDDLSAVWTKIVKNSVDQANTAVGTLANKGNLSQILAKASLRDQGGNYIIGTQTISKDTVAQPGTVYEIINPTGKSEFHLFLGEEYGEGQFVPLYGQD
jgi:hypothetical protein